MKHGTIDTDVEHDNLASAVHERGPAPTFIGHRNQRETDPVTRVGPSTTPVIRPSASQVVLAADVGGTHARIGLVAVQPEQALQPATLAYHSYRCSDWPGLADILDNFLDRHARGRHAIASCALAVAGYVRNDELVAENLRWPVRISVLRERLHFERLDIVNDFEALACATQFVHREDAVDIIPATGCAGPTVVVGPGTGLGCAALVPVDGRRVVIPSEAGHIALAPGTAREIVVLHLLGRDRAYVHTGHVLSGPGLLNLYRALCEIDGVAAIHVEPAAVSAAALRGDDPSAREALAMFCTWLGSFAGDLAVIFKAAAGVYLAGGILPSIRDFLLASEFRARFLNKGLMRPFLANVPVRLIEHGQLGVLGAAALVEGGLRHRDTSG